MRNPIDQAAFHVVMAELIRRNASPEALEPTEPNAPDILLRAGGEEYRIRVKGYEGPSPRWRCIAGQGQRVFQGMSGNDDFVALVGMSTRADGVLSWVYLRPTHEVAQEVNQHGQDIRPSGGVLLRELRLATPDVPGASVPTNYQRWQEYRNAWRLLGLPDVVSDAA